jgi:hypothetical protein
MNIINNSNSTYNLTENRCGDNFMNRGGDKHDFIITIPKTYSKIGYSLKIAKDLFKANVVEENENFKIIFGDKKGMYQLYFRYLRDEFKDETDCTIRIYELKHKKPNWSLLFCAYLIMQCKKMPDYSLNGGFINSYPSYGMAQLGGYNYKNIAPFLITEEFFIDYFNDSKFKEKTVSGNGMLYNSYYKFAINTKKEWECYKEFFKHYDNLQAPFLNLISIEERTNLYDLGKFTKLGKILDPLNKRYIKKQIKIQA